MAKRKEQNSNFLLIFGSIWIIAAIIFGWAGKAFLNREEAYAAQGVVTAGTILSKHSEERYDSREKRNETHYYITYEFHDASGTRREVRHGVGSTAYASAAAGKPLEIEYLRSDSTISRIAGESETFAGWGFLGFGFLSAAVGVTSVVLDVRKRFSHRRLFDSGTRAEGTVTSIAPTRISVNGERRLEVHYTFKDLLGKTHKGKTAGLPPDQARIYTIGSPVNVRYDRNNPASNVLAD